MKGQSVSFRKARLVFSMCPQFSCVFFYAVLSSMKLILPTHFCLRELLVVWFDTVHIAGQSNLLSILPCGVKRRPVRKVLAVVCL